MAACFHSYKIKGLNFSHGLINMRIISATTKVDEHSGDSHIFFNFSLF